jgi:CubicO group peptidase (beta-lactamase class C family)
MARFGYLFLRNGHWKDRQLVSENWIKMARKPGPANANYGFANWFLNTGKKALQVAPESSGLLRRQREHHLHRLENDVVAVVRWIGGGGALGEFVERFSRR